MNTTVLPEKINYLVDYECIYSFMIALDPNPDARFIIEHYTDAPKGATKPNPDPQRGQHPNLNRDDVAKLLPLLRQHNDEGAGIFIAVNQFNGNRRKADLERVRGCHADFDGVSNEQIQNVCNVLAPTILVKSSKGKYHAYWLLKNGQALDIDLAEGINRHFVQEYGADKAAVDVTRLLRLPGFRHMKYRANGSTPMVEFKITGGTYSAQELLTAFPPIQQPSTKIIQPPVAVAISQVNHNQLIARVASLAMQDMPHLWSGAWERTGKAMNVGYESQSDADLALVGCIARNCVREGVPSSKLFSAIESVFGLSVLSQREKWQHRRDYRERTINKAIAGIQTPKEGVALGLAEDSHGDIRNARVFAKEWRGQLLHVVNIGDWLKWTDEGWRWCEKNEHVQCAKAVAKQLMAEAQAVLAHDHEKGKRLIQHAMNSHNLNRIEALIKLSISEPGMAATMSELDCDPWLLGVRNGVVDLRSGGLLKNEPEMRITRLCNASHDRGSTCPNWLGFLDQVFQSDAATIETIQRALGYTLTGQVTEEVMFICFGYGSNGKSVFNNVISNIIGDYGRTAPSTLLTLRRADDSGPRNDLAALAGARYVSINELQAGDRLDEQIVKQLAGREPISARYLHKEFFSYMPTFKPWLRTNHKPIITGEDDGLWRRLVLIPFRRKFTDREKDPYLEQKLLDERDGILMWMIEGALKWKKDGLKLSPTIKAEHQSYRKESDLLGDFLSEQYQSDPNGKVEQGEVFSRWRQWCFFNGVKHSAKASFTRRMAERGHTEAKSGGKRFYSGLAVRSGQAMR